MVVTKGLPDPHGRDVVQAKNRPGAPAKTQAGWLGSVRKVLKFIAEQWLVIGFGLACLFGYLWPEVASKGGVIRSEYSVLYGSVGIIFFISGMQLAPDKLRQNLFNWRLHIITQGISFILIPLIWLAILWIIIAARGTEHIEPAILVGMIALSCLPTTIASNVVMTRNAGGDDAAAIIEVVIGNVFGSFLCPGLIYVFIPTVGEFRDWTPSDASGIPEMYRHVAMQLGLSVLIPIGLGQTLRVFLKKQVLWALDTFCLSKVSTFFLCTLVWTTFSNAFQTGAIQGLPTQSILFNVFMNIGLYALFTGVCFVAARPPHRLFIAFETRAAQRYLPQWVRRAMAPKQMSKEQTVAVCFCGAAKTTSVGIPLVAAMWHSKDTETQALLDIPVLLYTMEQVFLAQVLVYVFRWYLRRGEVRKESMVDLEEALRGRRGGLPPSRGGGGGPVGVEDVDGAGDQKVSGGGGVGAGGMTKFTGDGETRRARAAFDDISLD
ncbi:sodium/bile acid cotransporter [Diaporthe helianthi]|uniref:Sodium/bile acid cotransporter n=1 Tax=Diaporthe helianthi TaxID=158607 RepID=A0A2P5I3U0_DIAHE|nr:sodium/bile acid cotransporter [Diaporthe helianthi]